VAAIGAKKWKIQSKELIEDFIYFGEEEEDSSWRRQRVLGLQRSRLRRTRSRGGG